MQVVGPAQFHVQLASPWDDPPIVIDGIPAIHVTEGHLIVGDAQSCASSPLFQVCAVAY